MALVDHRGRTIDDQPDLGAVEYQGFEDTLRVWPVDTDFGSTPIFAEIAFGTENFVPDAEDLGNVCFVRDGSGNPGISFRRSPIEEPNAIWIVRRSTDLVVPTEIYRYDGSSQTQTTAPSIIATITPENIDAAAPEPRLLYELSIETAARKLIRTTPYLSQHKSWQASKPNAFPPL